MNKVKSVLKKLTSFRLFLPIMCLLLVLLMNVIKTPTFFNITVNNGVFYGYIIDVINRGSELVIFAVGMTLVIAASGGTDISVGAVSALAGAACSIFYLVDNNPYHLIKPRIFLEYWQQ